MTNSSVELLQKVWVQLSEKGKERLKEMQENVDSVTTKPGVLTYKIEADDWYETTLGNLMRDFGSVTHMGFQSPFRGNSIYFEKPF